MGVVLEAARMPGLDGRTLIGPLPSPGSACRRLGLGQCADSDTRHLAGREFSGVGRRTDRCGVGQVLVVDSSSGHGCRVGPPRGLLAGTFGFAVVSLAGSTATDLVQVLATRARRDAVPAVV